MARFVPDTKTKRWVVINPGKNELLLEAAKTVESTHNICVFCKGNEALTTDEVWRVGGEGLWNRPGWELRVVPNKYPITDVHEVIVHSPDHEKDIDEYGLQQVRMLFEVYRQRYQAHEKDGQVLIFCNHGEHAGASSKHPHSQLVVLPQQITFDSIEKEPFANIVAEDDFFVTYCPEFSQWPYEVWIAPKIESRSGRLVARNFGSITDEEISHLAVIFQGIIQKLKLKFNAGEMARIPGSEELNYNYYIYHGPDWYLRIVPRTLHRAGFEIGTGLSFNSKDPAVWAEELKQMGE